MPKAPNQKLKLLYLAQILMEQTDERHPMTLPQLQTELARYDISAERKSIYDDLEALRQFGLDVLAERQGARTGYYIGSRVFELPELKQLVDSVQSSKFITQKKTLALIKKIEGLASVHEARLLQRQVYVLGRVKSMNESVYYNVDEISAAITQDCALRFRYFEYTPDQKRRYRHEGAFYEVSPFALMWDDENYYMLAWDAPAGRMKHYRVDKMTQLSLCEQPRSGKEAFAQVDMSSYTRKVFGMFTGEEQKVQLRFCNHLAGAVLDRFGKDVMLVPEEDGKHFRVTLEVAVSPQFYAWLFGFGAEVEALAPEQVRIQLRQQAQQVAALYGEAEG